MASHPRGMQVHVDDDGVRVARPSPVRTVIRLTLVAMGVVVLAVIAALVGLRLSPADRVAREAPPPPDVVARNQPPEPSREAPAAADLPAPPVVPAASHPGPPATTTS